MYYYSQIRQVLFAAIFILTATFAVGCGNSSQKVTMPEETAPIPDASARLKPRANFGKNANDDTPPQGKKRPR